MAITQEKNIEMLEKLADGNFKIKYPKTKDTQVIGLETSQKILDKIKTVDGVGSGLDADLLDGKHASDFQLSNKTYGFTDYNSEPITFAGVTKRIPIGTGKTNAIVGIVTTYAGGLVFCGIDKNKTYIISRGSSSYVNVGSRQIYDTVTNESVGSDIMGSVVTLVDMYIQGSDLVFTVRSTSDGTRYLKCKVFWEVW